jgi:molybdopterin synthase sulfur carrier subunit
MPVEVRIPTILRTYTGGEKAVPGEGTTLSEVIDHLESNHPGIKERLIEKKDGEDGEGDIRRFVNVYVNDEDVRFTGGLATSVSDGDQVVVLPAVAGGDNSATVAGGDSSATVAGGDSSATVAGGDNSATVASGDNSATVAGG